ncbi:NTP transferase domain-containing protein [Candidatus Peregrinibacteria bacterium]|jgi:UDP-N-acetylglucosamine diphosphorylase / glucose-1-phosphate thymidylyltransferase / UDP-N-acetylgalactosamine diphosphorylase / glucosamine-1-phosphate N-acetyltransferase / galactosamine-1-phosphate N-acetyltransferase|nr:NTP transferase domain-containing protein [Candidatus Peregrinibacteria bacterium]
MKAILLAAGRSKRVKPILDKNFISFCGKYLIEWQVNSLVSAGINEIVIVGNKYNLEHIQEFAEEFKTVWGDELTIDVTEQKKLDEGMAGGVMACKEFFDDGPALIVSSNDVVDEAAYASILSSKDKGTGALLGYKVDEYFPGGYLKLGHGDKIEGIVEKPGEGKEPSDYVNIVVHLHNNYEVLFEALKNVKSEKDDRYEVALDNLINGGEGYEMVPYEGFWQPLKFPWHVFDLDKYFLKKRSEELEGNPDYDCVGEAIIHKSAEISDRAVIKGEVIVEEGVRIFENAVVQGPAYLEEGCVVGNNALFRDSFAGQGCVVGFTTEIARSHLGDNVWTHSNYIGDSVIGSNVSFGAGALTANLRLDEADIKWQGAPSGTNKLGLITGDHIRVGVQTSIMPGLSIGSNSMIGSGLTITEDIADDEFVYGETTLKRKKNKTDVSSLLRD